MMKYTSIACAVILAACAGPIPEVDVGPGAPSQDGTASVPDDGSASTATAPAAGTGGADAGPSRLSMFLTDAPAAYEHVWVTIDAVEVEFDDSWRVVSDEALHFDLLALQGGVLAALGSALLEPGHIGQIRLHVVDAEVTVDGVDHPLNIPSGIETGIKIPLDEDIVAGADYELVLDFDALRSVKQTKHGYMMKPVILVQEFEMISGPDGGEGLGGYGGALTADSEEQTQADDGAIGDGDASASDEAGH
jgi:hypothetical protein